MSFHIYSHSFQTDDLSELLENDQLEAGGWSESGPDRDEALPESKRSLVLQDLGGTVSESTVQLGIGWLVHKPGSNDVKWRDSACHEESC